MKFAAAMSARRPYLKRLDTCPDLWQALSDTFIETRMGIHNFTSLLVHFRLPQKVDKVYRLLHLHRSLSV